MKRIAIYPGSFDPVTNGHLDIIQRGLHLFDEIIVAVSTNPQKTPYFTLGERIQFLQDTLKQEHRIKIDHFQGLLADYIDETKAVAVIRGLRAVSDFEYEFQMALMNRHQNSRFETVFLMPDAKYTYLSSSLIRQISRLRGRVSGLVPQAVELALKKRAAKTS